MIDDPYELQTFAKRVLDRVAKIETHVINLLHPIQSISNLLKSPHDIEKLLRLLGTPITIDDRAVRVLIADFRNLMEEFKKDSKDLDLNQTLGEIKFIGKRLNEIEKTLSEMKSEGISKKIHMDFTVDGYEMVKKSINFLPDEPKIEPEDNLIELLKTLSERESKVVMHRLGLLGEKKKTFKEVGKVFGITLEPARQIYNRAIRKLRHPCRKHAMELVTHKLLRKEVLGE